MDELEGGQMGEWMDGGVNGRESRWVNGFEGGWMNQ